MDMLYLIIGIVLLWWVAKSGLSPRHRHKKLTQYRIKDKFFQDRFYEQQFANEMLRQERSDEQYRITCSLAASSRERQNP